MSDIRCVGFADCPCDGCRATRYAANTGHPDHTESDPAYCGTCQRAARATR